MKVNKQEIKDILENYLYDEINKMIIDEDFETLYNLDKKKYGKYFIRVNESSIIMKTRTIIFEFPYYDISHHQKKFLGISYGKFIIDKKETRIGKMYNKFYVMKKKYDKQKEYEIMINGLPTDTKKKLIRKSKFNSLELDD